MDKIAVIADWIRQANNIVAFTGAGISTPSGIPDFRSADSGLWEHVDPQRVASIYGFRKEPQAFFDWVRPLARKTLDAQPNVAHHMLVKLEQMGKLKAVITQNIDMLHTRAGTKTLFELHGNLEVATCINCFREYPGEPIIAQVLKDSAVPHCPACTGVLKPNVILFGEQLPFEPLMGAKKAVRNADVLIVIGSSLEVAPASELPLIAKRNGAKLVIINLEKTVLDRFADLTIHADAAETLPKVLQCLETTS
ncbi:MAG: SIR2 family NAD-dependent protein deacylase [Anaerolineae bacterium]